MKKIYTLLVVTALFTASTFGQSFSLQNINNYFQGSAGTFQYIGTVDVQNNSTTDKGVIMARVINNLAPGQESSFCWDVCYPPTTNVSGAPVTIPAGTYVSNAIADLRPYGNSGLSKVTYCWYDINNITDSVCLEFVYDLTTGINELADAKADFISLPHPNPADANTVIIYHLNKQNADSRILFYNVIGSKVLELKPGDLKESILVNTSHFPEGIYYYSLISGGKAVSTNKLIVSHKN